MGEKSSCRLWDIRLFVWLRVTKRSTTATLYKFSNLPLPAKVKVKKLSILKYSEVHPVNLQYPPLALGGCSTPHVPRPMPWESSKEQWERVSDGRDDWRV